MGTGGRPLSTIEASGAGPGGVGPDGVAPVGLSSGLSAAEAVESRDINDDDAATPANAVRIVAANTMGFISIPQPPNGQ